MDTLQPGNRSVSREKGPSETFPAQSRAGSERDPVRNGIHSRGTEENRSPTSMSKALESMLKTTTETGDIGMFSIKPSRVPQSMNTPRRIGGTYSDSEPQKPRQASQPYGVPTVDDRRRLPSYTRDATSEVVSMYETASQKSASRVFDDPDYRSYSMTQTSYSAYTLSNHRSYASLRSQPDGSGLLQRPRSPFAYPTRLKRPGFRPSSPALTDGGGIDYSRRAEVERLPYGVGHSTSSPSSLYAQKRKPPLSLRPEGNRSTPSLLSQPSPQRRSSSPHTRQGNVTPGGEWPRRNGTASVNTSPVRSTFSLASTVNFHASVQALSTITTPGKAPPPSPLYYDYTEDFEAEEYNQSEPLAPPPQFRIDKTIPEDRPTSAEQTPTSDTLFHGVNPDHGLRVSPSSGSIPRNLLGIHSTNIITRSTKQPDPASTRDETSTSETLSPRQTDRHKDTNIIRLSGLGYGARELSTHVEEAFGLLPSPSFEIPIPKFDGSNSVDERRADPSSTNEGSREVETQSARSSSYSLNTQLPKFPSPPSEQSKLRKEISTENPLPRIFEKCGTSHVVQENLQPSQCPPQIDQVGYFQAELARNDSFPFQHSRTRVRSSVFNSSIDTGLTELANLITTIEDASRSRSPGAANLILIPPGRTPMTSPTIPDESVLYAVSSGRAFSPPLSSVNRDGRGKGQAGEKIQQLNRVHNHRRGQKLDMSVVTDYRGDDMPSFGHQIPRKVMPRSESPMLAPKPISPARQLKLKNSIPQLMKALPPLPPEPAIRAVSPPAHHISLDTELPCRFSPLLTDFRASPSQEHDNMPEQNPHPPADKPMAFQKRREVALAEKSRDLLIVESKPTQGSSAYMVVEQNATLADPPLQPPRLKLKMRNSVTLRPLSPPDSRPWNLEESYPWANQNINVHLPPIISERAANKNPPKFKLKITRASNSTQGTVRINRESGESNTLAPSHLRSPKDLFTPAPGIDSIFRQVSKHIHSRKTSASSNRGINIDPTPVAYKISHPPSANDPLTVDLSLQQLQPTLTSPLSLPEALSIFSNDSSYFEGNPSLRGRLSSLRARIPIPYTSRAGTQSYDDITWKDWNGAEAAPPPSARSIPNLHGSNTSGETKLTRRFMEGIRRQRLKAKVQGWFRGARSAIAARVKPRSRTL